jgi:hypothetical protein
VHASGGHASGITIRPRCSAKSGSGANTQESLSRRSTELKRHAVPPKSENPPSHVLVLSTPWLNSSISRRFPHRNLPPPRTNAASAAPSRASVPESVIPPALDHRHGAAKKCCCNDSRLSRSFLLLKNGTLLDSYEVDANAGTLLRLRSDQPTHCATGKSVVTYSAGSSIPEIFLTVSSAPPFNS